MRIEGDRANFRTGPVVREFTFVLSTAVPPAGSFCGPSTAQHAHSPHFLPTARRPVVLPSLGVCLEVFGSVNHPLSEVLYVAGGEPLENRGVQDRRILYLAEPFGADQAEMASLDSRPLASSRGEELASPARSP